MPVSDEASDGVIQRHSISMTMVDDKVPANMAASVRSEVIRQVSLESTLLEVSDQGLSVDGDARSEDSSSDDSFYDSMELDLLQITSRSIKSLDISLDLTLSHDSALGVIPSVPSTSSSSIDHHSSALAPLVAITGSRSRDTPLSNDISNDIYASVEMSGARRTPDKTPYNGEYKNPPIYAMITKCGPKKDNSLGKNESVTLADEERNEVKDFMGIELNCRISQINASENKYVSGLRIYSICRVSSALYIVHIIHDNDYHV